MEEINILAREWDRGADDLKAICVVLEFRGEAHVIKYSNKEGLQNLLLDKFFVGFDKELLASDLIDILEQDREKYLVILKNKARIKELLRVN